MAAASETLKRVFLELGGKSAAIVLDDADFNTCGPVLRVRMVTHAGQGCALTTRMLVPQQAPRRDRRAGQELPRAGPVRRPQPTRVTYMGPLISEKQRDKVDGMVQRAVEAGATLVTGGEKVDPGYFYTPTLLTDVDPDSEIAQEEVFGPVLVVIAYDDDDDAVRIANNSIYGLSGAVFGSEDRAIAVARRIRTGTFSINGGMLLQPRQPVRRLQTDRHRPGDGHGRARRVPGDEDHRDASVVRRKRVMSRLEGIRVLEVAMYGFVPSAGAVLTEWGADVIKVEHAVTGDPQRGLRQTGLAARRGRPEPEHRARQPRQAQHRAGHVGARGQRGAARTRPPRRRFPDQLPARTPQEVRHRRRRHPCRQPEDHLRAGQRARSTRRGVGQGRLRHDRLLVPRRHRRAPSRRPACPA